MSIARNTTWNIAGALFPTLVSLAVLPYFLDLIGLERYGVLAILYVILGYFGLFDLGLGRATAQKIATLKVGTDAERSAAVWTALYVNLGFGVVGAALIAPLAILYFQTFMPLGGQLSSEAFAAALWLPLALPVALVTGVFTGALQGRERFGALNLINMVTTLSLQLFPLIAAIAISPNLYVILPAAIAARLLAAALLVLVCLKTVPLRRPAAFDRLLVRSLLRYGGWITVSSLVSPILDTADRMILGAVSGPAAVSAYTIPLSLLRRAQIPATALSNALFPRLAGADSAAARSQLLEKSIASLAALLTPGFLVVGFLLNPFLTWWIDRPFADHAGPIGVALLFGVWANCMAKLPYAELQASGRPDLIAKCHAGELLPFVVTIALLVWILGAFGAAVAWSMRATLDAGLLFALSARSVAVPLKALAIPLALILIATTAILTVPASTRGHWLLAGGLVSASLSYAVLVFPWAVLHRVARRTNPGFSKNDG